MTTGEQPNAEEVIVKARYFVDIDIDEGNLQNIQNELIRVLQQEGYKLSDADMHPFGPPQRTMEFHLYDGIPIEEKRTVSKRVKDFFGSGQTVEQREISTDEYLEGLKKIRDDLPFRFVFHFRSYEDEDIEGYEIEIESIPALLQKYRQLSLGKDYNYNIQNVVDENKRELKRIMGKLGLEPLSGPNTEIEMETEKQDMNPPPLKLFKQYSVTAQLQAIVEPDSQLHQDYQKAVREFKNGEYEDSIRDIGRAGETLIGFLCDDLYGENDVPDSMNGQLNKLDKTEDGIPSYIGKTVSPLWWLRNKVNHPTEYEITKDDAHYALLCFQIAVEKYVEDFSNIDVVY